MILLAVASLLGGVQASPPPSESIAGPQGWRSAPQLAAAASDVMRSRSVRVVASDGWAEPAIGCYAVWLRGRGPEAPIDLVARQLVDSVASSGFAVDKVMTPTTPTAHGVVELEFGKPPYRGTLRAVISRSGELEMLACAWNLREPTICAAACAKLVEAVR